MSNWDGIPAELHPDKQDVGLLEAILRNVIEAYAIKHDYDSALSLQTGERRLAPLADANGLRKSAWESNFVRAGGLLGPVSPFLLAPGLAQFGVVFVAPPKKWNEKIEALTKHSAFLARGVKSEGLRKFMLRDTHHKKMNGEPLLRMDYLTYGIFVEKDGVPHLRRPDRRAEWFVPGRPDRLIRWLRREGPH
jgi:hypothetical protein